MKKAGRMIYVSILMLDMHDSWVRDIVAVIHGGSMYLLVGCVMHRLHAFLFFCLFFLIGKQHTVYRQTNVKQKTKEYILHFIIVDGI